MISYGRQLIDDDDIAAVAEALKGDFLTTGPLVEKFENELEKFVGAPCVTYSSGTAALHSAYAALEIRPGDEIITPPITFIATQATAALSGAKVIFADVLEDTLTIDPQAAEAAITKNTRAIVAVDYAGHPAEMSELRRIATKYNIFLVEDAAHSLGSKYFNRPVGSLADITTFSFFPTKNIATGEGGAISSSNLELLDRAKKFGRQGLIRNPEMFRAEVAGPWHQEVHEFGLNYRLPDILCALGISQLKKIESFKARRKEIFDFYISALSNNSDITLPKIKEGADPMWHLFPIRVPSNLRLALFEHLRGAKIGVQINYFPAYRHPVFGLTKKEFSMFPVSEEFYSQTISLPIHVGLTDENLCFIVTKIHEILGT